VEFIFAPKILHGRMEDGFDTNRYEGTLTLRGQAGLVYAGKLTKEPASIRKSEVKILRSTGFDDGEILVINQVTAYFNYADRTVFGLSINTCGDVIGLAPRNNENSDDRNHD
jgi:uncharacterized protein YciW